MRERETVAPLSLFRWPMLWPMGILYALGALLGLGAVVALFLPGAVATLETEMLQGGITDDSSIRTWTVIHISLMLVGTICAWGIFLGVLREWRRMGTGIDQLYIMTRVLLWASRGSGVFTLALCFWRVVRYLANCNWAEDGIYSAYVMLLPEALMVAQAVGLYVLVQRFLEDLSGATLSMGYTRVCQKLDDRTIPAFCGTGFYILAALNAYLAMDRMLTLTAVQTPEGGYYAFLLANHPMNLSAAGMFACCAAANLLMGVYLHRYKRLAGRAMYRTMRETLDE